MHPTGPEIRTWVQLFRKAQFLSSHLNKGWMFQDAQQTPL